MEKLLPTIQRLNTTFSCSPTCESFSPLESESDVSLYWELAISTSVEARLRFFRGLQESEISLAPKTITKQRRPVKSVNRIFSMHNKSLLSASRATVINKNRLEFVETLLHFAYLKKGLSATADAKLNATNIQLVMSLLSLLNKLPNKMTSFYSVLVRISFVKYKI